MRVFNLRAIFRGMFIAAAALVAMPALATPFSYDESIDGPLTGTQTFNFDVTNTVDPNTCSFTHIWDRADNLLTKRYGHSVVVYDSWEIDIIVLFPFCEVWTLGVAEKKGSDSVYI